MNKQERRTLVEVVERLEQALVEDRAQESRYQHLGLTLDEAEYAIAQIRALLLK